MSDADLLLRVFRVALQRIAEEPDGYCHCEHDDENCCEEMEMYCPICIAGKALAMETKVTR
jgi:hypothetical protein